jgi:pimeloyl-ACP methyl ester carboxylesterase
MSSDPPRPLHYVSVGDGKPLVLLHGFAMKPETYLPLARILGTKARIIIPAIFELQGAWTFRRALAKVQATLDYLDIDKFSLLGHSFGGGLELGLACEIPERVVECVFGDTLGMEERFGLAEEATSHPLGLLHMATPPATKAFFESIIGHPVQMLAAAMWGFTSDREPYIRCVVANRIPCHVLWASRDSLLARSDGEQFARSLHATFNVASEAGVDHDWMFDDPELFAEHLYRLGLQVFGGERPPGGRASSMGSSSGPAQSE